MGTEKNGLCDVGGKMGYNWEAQKFFSGLRTGYNWEARIRREIIDGEHLLDYNGQVRSTLTGLNFTTGNVFSFFNSQGIPACIAITSKRIILITYGEKDIERTYNFSSILYFFESKRQPLKPNWPYRGNMILLGGFSLFLDSYDEDSLSKLLTEAYFRFNIKDFDYGAIAALIAEQRRQSESRSSDEYDKKKEENN